MFLKKSVIEVTHAPLQTQDHIKPNDLEKSFVVRARLSLQHSRAHNDDSGNADLLF